MRIAWWPSCRSGSNGQAWCRRAALPSPGHGSFASSSRPPNSRPRGRARWSSWHTPRTTLTFGLGMWRTSSSSTRGSRSWRASGTRSRFEYPRSSVARRAGLASHRLTDGVDSRRRDRFGSGALGSGRAAGRAFGPGLRAWGGAPAFAIAPWDEDFLLATSLQGTTAHALIFDKSARSFKAGLLEIGFGVASRIRNEEGAAWVLLPWEPALVKIVRR